MAEALTKLFACGDAMPGRGVDQALPYAADPELRETYATDALAYVRLAECANGPIPRPVPMQARKMRLRHARVADSRGPARSTGSAAGSDHGSNAGRAALSS